MATTLNTGAGNGLTDGVRNTINVGIATQVLDEFPGPLTVFGQAGSDNLVFVDSAPTNVLAAPTPTSPEGNANTTTPTFKWSTVTGATGYALNIVDTTGNSFWSFVVNPTQADGASYPLAAPLIDGHTYQWQVLAYDNAVNESAFSKPATFTVVPAGAQLKLLTQPTSVVAFAHFGLTVQVEDDQGNVFSDYEGNVTVSLANNPSDLEGTLTETAVNGVATFSGLTLPKSASGDKIQVTASGLTTVTTGTITVTPSAATKLEVTEQPPSKVDLGGLFSVTVTAENASGSPVNNFFGTVTVALANNPGGATLGGTLTVTAADGVASFPILRLNRADTGYTLSFTGSGLTGTTTDAFTVDAPRRSWALQRLLRPLPTRLAWGVISVRS